MHATVAFMLGMLLHRGEYEALVERGVFVDVRCELLEGRLVGMAPQGEAHADVVSRLAALVTLQLGRTVRVRCQLPMNVGELSVPEPDLVVAPLSATRGHPSTAFLVVEVAVSSIERDLGKAALYARAGVPAYWLVDLVGRQVRVFGEPVDGAYRSCAVYGPGDVLRVEALPGLAVAVAELLD